MELAVAVLVVLALAAILGRFVFRDASGQLRLPRIVDDSVGMWAIRRLLGRPTDRIVDPFAPFRRPSTVIGRRPAHVARGVAAIGRGAARRDPPSVLREPVAPAELETLAPAWSTIERKASGGRAFGASILTPAPASTPSRLRTLLRYGVLVVAVSIGGLAVGALAGVASGPSPSSAGASPAGSAPRGSVPAGSPGTVAPR